MSNYNEFLEHINQRCKELGISKNDYHCTEEYKRIYPKIRAAHKAEFGNAKRRRRPKPTADDWMKNLFYMGN